MFAAPNTTTAYTASFEEVMFDLHTVEPVLAEMHAIHDTINDLNAVKFSFENYGVTKSAMAIIDKDGLLSSSIASVPAYESLVGDYAAYSTKAEGAVEGLIDTIKEQLAKFASAAAKGFSIVVEKLQAAGSAFVGWFSKKKDVVEKADNAEVDKSAKLPPYAVAAGIAGLAVVAVGAIAIFFPKALPATKDALQKHWKSVADRLSKAKLQIPESNAFLKGPAQAQLTGPATNVLVPVTKPGQSLVLYTGAAEAPAKWNGKFGEVYNTAKSSFSMETLKRLWESIANGFRSAFDSMKKLDGEALKTARQWLVDTAVAVWHFVRDNVLKAMAWLRSFFSKVKVDPKALGGKGQVLLLTAG